VYVYKPLQAMSVTLSMKQMKRWKEQHQISRARHTDEILTLVRKVLKRQGRQSPPVKCYSQGFNTTYLVVVPEKLLSDSKNTTLTDSDRMITCRRTP
jgi:hypothetical protein